jgi:hypothetical protein
MNIPRCRVCWVALARLNKGWDRGARAPVTPKVALGLGVMGMFMVAFVSL